MPIERGSCRFNLRKTSEGKPVIEMEMFHNTVPHLAAVTLSFEVLSGITIEQTLTRITCGYYRTRASQVGGCPFNAQDPEQNCFAVTGRQSLLGVATESGMFSLELLLL